MVVTVDVQEVMSPGYPGDYYDNRDCEWMLIAEKSGSRIIIDFIEFRTEECCDYVTVSEIFACKKILALYFLSLTNYLLEAVIFPNYAIALDP